MRRFTTSKHIRYWQNRQIDWRQSYFDTWNHPHRFLLIEKLKKMKWNRLFEVGCASGPNLYLIYQNFPERHLAGVDINKDAVKTAHEVLNNKIYVGLQEAENLYVGDNGTDVILTDMCLIYLGPKRIHNALKEMIRSTKKYLMFCELHSSNPFKQWGLRLSTGYNAYNYIKILSMYGLHSIEIDKIPVQCWPKNWPIQNPEDRLGGEPQKTFGYIITAKK